jgi:hypothetical protein
LGGTNGAETAFIAALRPLLRVHSEAYLNYQTVSRRVILGSSLPVRHQCLKIRNLRDPLLYLMGVRYIRVMDR